MSQEEYRAGAQYWQMIKPVWGTISIYDGAEEFLRQFRSVNSEVGHLFAAHWLYSEVCNGGFHQFFTNATGVLAPEAREGFRTIGLGDCAVVIDEAMRFFGSSYPREQEERYSKLDDLPGDTRTEWDPFHMLDTRFYELLHIEEDRFRKAADEYARRYVVEQPTRA